MATLDTVQKILDSARRLLQDRIVPYRYANEELIAALNEGVLEARRLRPDLFLPAYTLPEYVATSDAVALPDMYRPAFVMYVAGRIQMSDDEDTQDSRAAAFMNTFTAKLLVVTS